MENDQTSNTEIRKCDSNGFYSKHLIDIKSDRIHKNIIVFIDLRTITVQLNKKELNPCALAR